MTQARPSVRVSPVITSYNYPGAVRSDDDNKTNKKRCRELAGREGGRREGNDRATPGSQTGRAIRPAAHLAQAFSLLSPSQRERDNNTPHLQQQQPAKLSQTPAQARPGQARLVNVKVPSASAPAGMVGGRHLPPSQKRTTGKKTWPASAGQEENIIVEAYYTFKSPSEPSSGPASSTSDLIFLFLPCQAGCLVSWVLDGQTLQILNYTVYKTFS